ncbi:MAG: heme-binding protein [Actinomycetales bacterium]|nr:heme-binding protein [Actinomycetales bacterium]
MARVTRFEVDLDLAQRMAAAARGCAQADGALVSVAIVDAGGNLLVFERMDGAEIAGPVLARDKAYTAVAHRIGTHELTALVAPGAPLAGMYAQDAGRYVAFPGGLPLWDADRVIGGIGVSGGSAEQDRRAAEAAHEIYRIASGIQEAP